MAVHADPLKIVVRAAAPSEAGLLAAVCTETFTETYASENTAENMELYVSAHFTPERQREELEDKKAKIFFALHEEEVVGYIKLNFEKGFPEPIADALEIERIYVRKKFHGRHIGRLLFNKAVAEAKARRHAYIWLGVWEKNTNAIGFYTRMGCKNAGSHLFKLGEDLQLDIIMKYDLGETP
jgi:hypothetical protein